MNIRIKVEATRVLQKITGAKGKLEREVSNAVAKAGMNVARYAKRDHPYKNRTSNNTNSIISNMSGPFEAKVTVDNTAYGAYLEYGTSKMRPFPYMRPAAAKVKPEFEADMARIARSIL